MTKKTNKILYVLFLLIILLPNGLLFAQGVKNYNATDLLPRAEIFVAPRTGSFLVGSTFESQIYIDTKGQNINAINLRINYDQNKLALVNPSGGKSIFGIWVEPPYYDNNRGVAGMAGIITDGVNTSSGLIVTMTFKVLSAGQAAITISDQTTANLNNGLGSEVLITKGRAVYSLNNRPPEGVRIFSETHPNSDNWYNNNSPIFAWVDRQVSEGYSILFDTVFQSVPETKITTKDATHSELNIKDGIWYLHVRPVSKNVWGAVATYPVRIDTKPPADFKPKVSKIKDEKGNKQFLVSFFTTDALSGLSHYEVGVIDKKVFDQSSPVFIETTSPYIVNPEAGKNSRVIIRAYDLAGNMNEKYVDIYPGLVFFQKGQKVGLYILLVLLFLLAIEFLLHYMYNHHLIDKIRLSYKVFRNISNKELGGKDKSSEPPTE